MRTDLKIELAVKSVPVECGLVCFTDLIFWVLNANVDTTVLPESTPLTINCSPLAKLPEVCLTKKRAPTLLAVTNPVAPLLFPFTKSDSVTVDLCLQQYQCMSEYQKVLNQN